MGSRSPVNSENASLASYSPSYEEDRVSVHSTKATPELMNVSPMTRDPSQSDSASQNQKALDDAIKQREWLDSQRKQLQSQIKAMEFDAAEEIDNMAEDKLLELYEMLKEELLKKTVQVDCSELLLKAEHLNQTMLTVMQASPADLHDMNMVQQKRELESLMAELISLTSQIATNLGQREQMQNGAEKIKKENKELIKRVRNLYSEIDQMKKSKEEEMKLLTQQTGDNSLHEQLEIQLQQLALTTGVTQGLLLGSKVNWAQDEKLKKLMIESGQTVDI